MELKEHNPSSPSLDALFCEEQSEVCDGDQSNFQFLDQNLFCEDEELESLFSRENQIQSSSDSDSDSRREAVTWILRVSYNYGFATATAVLAVNFLDRFGRFQKLRPWTVQLAAVASLSLAAKMEETHAPPLSDLQVEETEHVFEAKTIQRMELLVLSTLQWRMNLVTPISFLDHFIGRLRLNNHRRRCERLLLSAVADSRFVGFFPSVVAGATVMRIVDRFEPGKSSDYRNQLLGVLKNHKEEVNACYELVLELSDGYVVNVGDGVKRKYSDRRIPTSPSGVIEASFDNSEDCCSPTSSSACSSAETEHGRFKKSKTHRHWHGCVCVADNRVSVDFVENGC